eukprot:8837628-Lingulodinium_polyedra.AAC.1
MPAVGSYLAEWVEHVPWAWRRTPACWNLGRCTSTMLRAITSTAAFSCRGSTVRCRPGCVAPPLEAG